MSEEPYYVMEIVRPDGGIDSFDISGATCILGRSAKKADLVVEDAKASSQHAEIRFEGGRVTVHDLNSTNGTHFDGRRASAPFGLQPGQWFGIGDTKVRLVTIRGLAPAAPPPMETDEATRALSPEALDALRDSHGAPLPEDAAQRTVAFDRASVPIGHYDSSEHAAEPAPAPRPGRGLIAWLGLVLIAPYALAIGLLVTLSEGTLGPILAGERGDMVVRQSERAMNAAEEAAAATGAEKVEKLEEAKMASDFASRLVTDLSEHMDRVQIILWIGMGAGLLGGLLVFFGLRVIGGLVILAGVGVPFAIYQPTPVEPTYFTAALALYALFAIGSRWIGRRA